MYCVVFSNIMALSYWCMTVKPDGTIRSSPQPWGNTSTFFRFDVHVRQVVSELWQLVNTRKDQAALRLRPGKLKQVGAFNMREYSR